MLTRQEEFLQILLGSQVGLYAELVKPVLPLGSVFLGGVGQLWLCWWSCYPRPDCGVLLHYCPSLFLEIPPDSVGPGFVLGLPAVAVWLQQMSEFWYYAWQQWMVSGSCQ